jgi:hypothetical protein
MEDLRKALRCARIMGSDKVRIFAGARAAGSASMLQLIAGTIAEMALGAEKQEPEEKPPGGPGKTARRIRAFTSMRRSAGSR